MVAQLLLVARAMFPTVRAAQELHQASLAPVSHMLVVVRAEALVAQELVALVVAVTADQAMAPPKALRAQPTVAVVVEVLVATAQVTLAAAVL